MRLKPLLSLGVALTAGLLLLRGATLAWDARQMQALEAESARVEALARDAAALLVLTQDFALFGTSRAVRQWQTVHDRLLQALATPPAVDVVPASTTEDLRTTAAGLDPMFAALRVSVQSAQAAGGPRLDIDGAPSAEEAESERRASLVDQLLNETRRVSDGAFEVARAVAAARAELASRARTLEVATLLALASLMAGLALLVGRRVLNPLQRLRDVAEAVGRGHPAPRTGYRTADEMGAVARAMDDMTDALAARERELRQARHDAEAASEAKSLFLANMSHEIRTPMNAVLGLAHLLQDTPLSRPQQELLSRMHGASRSLMGVLDDVLDLSKIEAGELVVERTPVDLLGVLHDTSAAHEAQARARGLDWTFELDPVLPRDVMADGVRLRQILNNLLSNAVKFTPQGAIQLQARPLHEEAERPASARMPTGLTWIELQVRDTGIGMTPEVQGRLFRPFMQADASMTRRFGGTGLGLSIVARLVELLEGRLAVTSQPGRGTCFTVQLPVAPVVDPALAPAAEPAAMAGAADPGCRPDTPHGPPATQDTSEPQALWTPARTLQDRSRTAWTGALTGARVLLVDDSDDNLEVTGRLLQRAGATVAMARHGAEALERLAAEPQGHDLVLMDLQMPVLDGLQTTRLLRAEPALRHLPVIGLSASALASDRQRALDAGMEALVTKPFEPALLIERLQRRLGLHTLRQGAPTRPEAAASPAVSEPSAVQGATPSDHEWPRIDGLDLAGARRRLQDDLTLWRRLVRQMLATHRPAIRPDEDLDTRQRRMHRLAGAAGLIGAEDVRQAAMAAEAALRNGEVNASVQQHAMARVEESLRRLEVELAPFFVEPLQPLESAAGDRGLPHDTDLVEGPTRPPSRHTGTNDRTHPGIESWLAALARNDLSAVEQFEALAPLIQQRLGRQRHLAIERAIGGLRFEDALAEWHAGNQPAKNGAAS